MKVLIIEQTRDDQASTIIIETANLDVFDQNLLELANTGGNKTLDKWNILDGNLYSNNGYYFSTKYQSLKLPLVLDKIIYHLMD